MRLLVRRQIPFALENFSANRTGQVILVSRNRKMTNLITATSMNSLLLIR